MIRKKGNLMMENQIKWEVMMRAMKRAMKKKDTNQRKNNGIQSDLKGKISIETNTLIKTTTTVMMISYLLVKEKAQERSEWIMLYQQIDDLIIFFPKGYWRK